MKEQNDTISLKSPLRKEDLAELELGDQATITGKVITARDEAYKRILEKSKEDLELPIDLDGAVIYHCGPLAKKEGQNWKIFAAGPTTSARMDDMEKEFIERTGIKGIIGKGGVRKEVAEKMGKLGCIYLAYTGGAAALAASAIKSIKDVKWLDLGVPEALWVLEVEKLGPLLVATDKNGRSIYRRGR